MENLIKEKNVGWGEIEQARQTLQSVGYCTNVLWHIEDVNRAIEDAGKSLDIMSEEEKRKLLENVLRASIQGINEQLREYFTR